MSLQPGFFDLADRYHALSEAGDPLEELSRLVDFEAFRRPLNKALKYADRGKGGRPPFDPVARASLEPVALTARCSKS